MSTTHRIDIVFGAAEGYTVQETKFMSCPAHITGTSLMIDVCTPDYSDIQTYGPFTWLDAVLYAEHAQGKDTFDEATKFLRDVSIADDAVDYKGRTPKNDWAGLLAPLAARA